MTSKEALKYLLINSEELYSQYEEDKKFYLDTVELYNIVLKDLEMLEMLKSHMNIETNYYDDNSYEQYEYIAYNNWELDIESKEEYKKIKEWLNNDNN